MVGVRGGGGVRGGFLRGEFRAAIPRLCRVAGVTFGVGVWTGERAFERLAFERGADCAGCR